MEGSAVDLDKDTDCSPAQIRFLARDANVQPREHVAARAQEFERADLCAAAGSLKR